MDAFYCAECGRAYGIDHDGVSRHMTADGDTDYDADADHVAYGKEPFVQAPDEDLSTSWVAIMNEFCGVNWGAPRRAFRNQGERRCE